MEDLIQKQNEIVQHIIACPSKILLIGGYSILNDGNLGISLAVDQQFYIRVNAKKISNIEQQNQSLNAIRISVNSVQFKMKWDYKLILDQDNCEIKLVQMQPENNESEQQRPNSFLEASINIVFGYLIALQKNYKQKSIYDFNDIEICLLCDKAFYSSSQCNHLQQDNEKFYIFDSQSFARKTGLGSSSCIVVCMVSALLQLYEILYLPSQKQQNNIQSMQNNDLLHLLCQMANNKAQNKIGSGFDISTCLFGSQVFRRVPKRILDDLAQKCKQQFNLAVIEEHRSAFSSKNMQKFNLNENIQIILLDFQMGSDSRLMAGNVLNYFQDHPDVQKQFHMSSNLFANEFIKNIQNSQNNQNSQNQKSIFQNMQNISREYRSLMKKLGVECQVQIEPDCATQILNETASAFSETIMYQIVPGAGGFDAACILADKQKLDLSLLREKLHQSVNQINLEKNDQNYIKALIVPIDQSLTNVHSIDNNDPMAKQINEFLNKSYL